MNSVLFDLPREQYDNLEGVNWSTLKLIGRSPMHYRWAKDHPEANDSDLFARGIAAHVAVLEPEQYGGQPYDAIDAAGAGGPRLYSVWPTANGKRGTKAWDAAEADCKHRGVTLLREVDHDWCTAIANAVHSCPAARPFLKGRREVAIRWEHVEREVGGLPEFRVKMRSRLDQLSYRDLLPFAIADLKTTRDASPEGFAREAARLGYDAQAALYSDGYSKAVGLTEPESSIAHLPYYWIAVESEPPHPVCVYRCTRQLIELGREKYRDLLQRLHACGEAETRGEADAWPGYATAPMDLEFPHWALPSDDMEEAA